MLRRAFVPAVGLVFATAGAVLATPTRAAWPPWLSIESPVNPFDASVRGAVMLVHTALRDGQATPDDLSGTAEGIVNGARRSIPLRFEATGYPGTFAVRRAWPNDGTWVLRITLRTTTALVALDRHGGVGSVHIPTRAQANGGAPIPRAVTDRDVDSTLAEVRR